MPLWLNAIGYQIVWFCAVIGAGRGTSWFAAVAASIFIAVQLIFSKQRAADLRLIALALACGVVLDGVLARSGWAHYAAPWPSPQFAPLWILAIWAAFAMTLTHSLAFLQTRPRAALSLGAIGGPLAYLGAARGFDAIAFIAPTWRALAWLALAWAIAMPLLSLYARRWTR